MQIIREWSAKRSGASITINGVDAETGGRVVVTNVTEITTGKTAEDGESRTLALIAGGEQAILA